MMCVSATKEKQSSPQALYSHCPYLPYFGWMFIWISLLVFQSQATSQSSGWLWTNFLSMPIFEPYPTLLQPLWWLNLSWIRSSNCMACLLPLRLIVTWYSLVTFGMNFSRYKAPKSNSVLPIIPKLMDKLKQSTNVWRHSSRVSLQKSNIYGYSGYL